MMSSTDENTPLLKRNGYCERLGEIERGVDANYIDIKNESVESNIEEETVKKQGSLVTIFVLWSSMMGTSLLAMPWAFQQAGLIQGLVLQVLLAAVSAYTGMLVLKASQRFVDPLTGNVPEFAEVCQKLLGRFGTIVTTQCSIVVFGGALIVFWILMSELLFSSVNSIHYFLVKMPKTTNTSLINTTGLEISSLIQFSADSNVTIDTLNQTCPDKDNNLSSSLPPIPAWTENRTVPLFLIAVFAPLIQLRSPSFFTRFGAAGCIPVIILILYSITKSIIWGVNIDFDDASSIHHVKMFSNNFPALSGVLTMAFFAHNSIVTFTKHSKNPRNNVRDLSISYVLVLVTYCIIGITIFVSFPNDKSCIKQNFFENISISDSLLLVAQITLFLRLVTLFPLACYLLRVQIFVPLKGSEYPGHLSVGILNIVIISLCVFCAVFYPNIGDIVRYAGAFCGMLYMFLLPCLIETMLERRRERGIGEKTKIFRHIFHALIVLFGIGNFFAQFAVQD